MKIFRPDKVETTSESNMLELLINAFCRRIRHEAIVAHLKVANDLAVVSWKRVARWEHALETGSWFGVPGRGVGAT